MKTIYTLAVLIVSTFVCAQNLKESTIKNEFKLTGDSISFPLTIVDFYPLISGEVNGIKGKFMFDTGHEGALTINSTIFPLTSQKEIGEGSAGSGQKFKQYTNDGIDEVKLINGLHFQNLKKIPSANFDFLQNGITSDYIGFIGYNFFKGYLFKLDYTKRKLTFYKNTSSREASKDFLNGEKVLAILDFEIRNLPNIPMLKVKVNDVEMLGLFDTGGSSETLRITDQDAENLVKKKSLTDYGKDGSDDNLYSLSNVKMKPKLTVNLIGIYKESKEDNVRKVLGITEDNTLSFAYRFLAKYKTVWDYEYKKIYVLEY